MKKIAVIGDIHSQNYLFEQLLLELENKKIDDYLFLGDYITDGPNANLIIDKIKLISNYVIAGNREVDLANYQNDSWKGQIRYQNMLYSYLELSTNNLDFIKKLPIYKIIEIESVKICISHGTPYQVDGRIWSDSFNLFEKLIADFNCDVYVFGHQHRPFQVKFRDVWFINPGSVSMSLDGKPTSKYGILTIDNGIEYQPYEIKYDFEKIKEYYLNSSYFKKCFEWSNILIYVQRDAIDYRRLFISDLFAYMNEKNLNLDNEVSEAIWNEVFLSFMEKNKLEIIRGGVYES